LIRFGVGFFVTGRVHTHVCPNLPPRGDDSDVTPRAQVANRVPYVS
jgi:hypothetical protein